MLVTHVNRLSELIKKGFQGESRKSYRKRYKAKNYYSIPTKSTMASSNMPSNRTLSLFWTILFFLMKNVESETLKIIFFQKV